MSRGGQPQTYTCALCERAVRQVSKHHIVPKSEGGRDTIDLCAACHKTLHSFFTNETLANELNTLEALRQDPDVARYLMWVRKQRDSRIMVRSKRERR
ncbi:MAG: HNH endonuclease [Chloroflexi bacterium]|nr:HNH endonuclease [Chloroflexota bacterium]